MKTITGNVVAWISYPERLKFDDENDVTNYVFTNESTDMKDAGWVEVGSASISITFLDDQTITAGQIAVLKDAKRKLQAETEAKLTVIEERIQSLLALPAPA